MLTQLVLIQLSRLHYRNDIPCFVLLRLPCNDHEETESDSWSFFIGFLAYT